MRKQGSFLCNGPFVPHNPLEQIKRNPDGEDSLGAAWFTLEQVKDLQLTPFAQYMMNLSQKER